MNILNGERKVIYRKDFDERAVYSIRISKKLKDGSYDNAYLPVQFKWDVDLQNKTTININQGWITFYKTKEGKAVFYIFISDFSVVHEEKIPNIKTETKALNSLDIEIKDEDLPF